MVTAQDIFDRVVAQDIFDRVVAHLLCQGCKSVDARRGTKRCMYNDGRGHKCAIGSLIPDEEYDPAFEGELEHLLRVWYTPASAGLWDHLNLLKELQRVHDISSVEDWVVELKGVGENFRLNLRALEQAP